MPSTTGTRLTTCVIVCTRGRPTELRRALASLAAQTMRADEVLVVDGSDAADEALACTPSIGRSPLRYAHTLPPGLTRQRNLAVALAQTDLCLFVDDDCECEPGYVEHVRDVFAGDAAGAIGAVLGRVIEPEGRLAARRSGRGALFSAALRFFLLPRPGPGHIQASGFQTLPHHLDGPRDVTCLSGGAMSFRRSLLAGLRFDEGLEGPGEMEDVDMARKVSCLARIRYEPAARVRHRPSPVGRDAEAARLARLVRHHRHVWRRHGPHDLHHEVARLWSVAGLLVLCLATRRLEATRAIVGQALGRGPGVARRES